VYRSASGIKNLLEGLSGAFASVFFPGDCQLCDQLLTDARRVPVCDPCLNSFAKIPAGSCDMCGLPGTFDPESPREFSYCQDCQQKRFAFQLARSFGFYEGTLARAVVMLKHEQIEPLGNGLLAALQRSYGKKASAWKST
jgi:predicted amidophosphoribosyltransferase